jgi:hypothetical protein
MADKEKKSIRKSKKKADKKPSKYNEKIVITGSFEGLIKELVTPKQERKIK